MNSGLASRICLTGIRGLSSFSLAFSTFSAFSNLEVLFPALSIRVVLSTPSSFLAERVAYKDKMANSKVNTFILNFIKYYNFD